MIRYIRLTVDADWYIKKGLSCKGGDQAYGPQDTKQISKYTNLLSSGELSLSLSIILLRARH